MKVVYKNNPAFLYVSSDFDNAMGFISLQISASGC